MGFDSSIFSEAPSEDLFCGICLDVFDECWKTKCNHRYCLSCLQLILTLNNPECSFDRTPLRLSECHVDGEINKRIGQLKKQCAKCKAHFPWILENKHVCKKIGVDFDRDTWINVFLFCDTTTLSRLGRCSKSVHSISMLGRIWKNLYLQKFGNVDTHAIKGSMDWRPFYKIQIFKSLEKKTRKHKNRTPVIQEPGDPVKVIDPMIGDRDIAFEFAIDLSNKQNNNKPVEGTFIEWDQVDMDEFGFDEDIYQFEDHNEDDDSLIAFPGVFYFTNEKMYPQEEGIKFYNNLDIRY